MGHCERTQVPKLNIIFLLLVKKQHGKCQRLKSCKMEPRTDAQSICDRCSNKKVDETRQ